MKKVNVEEVNKKMVLAETEKALKIKFIAFRADGEEKEIGIWVPKACVEITPVGLIMVKNWFLRQKQIDLHMKLTQTF